MSWKIRRKLEKRKRRIERRLARARRLGDLGVPVLSARTPRYELGERTHAIDVGGIGAVHLMGRRLDLARELDASVQVLKAHRPYRESDHVLNIAYNILCGGQVLDDIELRRNDETYLNALGAVSIPDPTTAGDFCRRFDAADVNDLPAAINRVRLNAWRQQPRAFEQALFDEIRYFFYITNDRELAADDIVRESNARCNQENLIEQLKNGVRALHAPVNTLHANWAYMVMAALAWSLKAWMALSLPTQARWNRQHFADRDRWLRMDFRTFLNAVIRSPPRLLKPVAVSCFGCSTGAVRPTPSSSWYGALPQVVPRPGSRARHRDR